MSGDATKVTRVVAARWALAEARAADPAAVDRYETRMARLSAAARRARAAGEGDLWCILRTSPGRTLALTRSLRDAGFDAWSPIEVRNVRRPRSHARVDREVAITPSLVFVKADRLLDLVTIGSLPTSPHPPFSIFRHGDRTPLIADSEIAAIRGAEAGLARVRRKAQRRRIEEGTQVRIEEGAFAGLHGVVERRGQRLTGVSFGGGFRVSVGAWLLLTDDVEAASSSKDTAARAA